MHKQIHGSVIGKDQREVKEYTPGAIPLSEAIRILQENLCFSTENVVDKILGECLDLSGRTLGVSREEERLGQLARSSFSTFFYSLRRGGHYTYRVPLKKIKDDCVRDWFALMLGPNRDPMFPMHNSAEYAVVSGDGGKLRYRTANSEREALQDELNEAVKAVLQRRGVSDSIDLLLGDGVNVSIFDNDGYELEASFKAYTFSDSYTRMCRASASQQ